MEGGPGDTANGRLVAHASPLDTAIDSRETSEPRQALYRGSSQVLLALIAYYS
jgi:hypothetical protein